MGVVMVLIMIRSFVEIGQLIQHLRGDILNKTGTLWYHKHMFRQKIGDVSEKHSSH